MSAETLIGKAEPKNVFYKLRLSCRVRLRIRSVFLGKRFFQFFVFVCRKNVIVQVMAEGDQILPKRAFIPCDIQMVGIVLTCSVSRCHADYFGRARSDYNGISYSTANSAYDSHNKEISDLLGRSRAIRSYLRDNRGSYSKEDYDQFNTQLHKINTALSGYSDAFFNAKKQMSKFGSEEEYNTARKNYEWQQKYKDSSIEDLQNRTLDDEEEQKWVESYIQYLDDEEKGIYDLVAGQKEIDDLKARLAEMEQNKRYESLQQRINPAKPTEPTRQDLGYNPHTMWQ